MIDINRIDKFQFELEEANYEDEEVMWAYNNSFSDSDCQSWLNWNLNSYKSYSFGLWKIINKETSLER